MTEKRTERLNKAVKHLISIGLIDGKSPSKSISTTMGRNNSNISSALRGDEKYLNRKFIRDFCATYNNIISDEWIWDGQDTMLNEEPYYEDINFSVYNYQSIYDLPKEKLIDILRQLIEFQEVQNQRIVDLIRMNEEMIRFSKEQIKNIFDINK